MNKSICDLTAFGEQRVITPHPEFQIDAIYGLRTLTDVQTQTSSGGSAGTTTTIGTDFNVQTGTNSAGFAEIKSLRQIRYRPGQGITHKGTARFTEGVANSVQFYGLTSPGSKIGFGYNGVDFGARCSYGGLLEIRTLTVTVANTGAETVTITLNGTATNVSVSAAANTTKHVAFSIAATAFSGWEAYHNGSIVIFIATRSGPKSGTFSIASTGTATGTWARSQVGVSTTELWFPRNKTSTGEKWNIDPCNGNGPSGYTLDVTKGNIYETKTAYLGYGGVLFSILDFSKQIMIPVHRYNYANTATTPFIKYPIMKASWSAENLGNTTNLAVSGACSKGESDGMHLFTRNPDSVLNSKTGVGTSFTNIISIRVRSTFNSDINLMEVWPMVATFAVEGTKTAEAVIYINPTLGGEADWTYLSSNTSVIEYDVTATTATYTAGNTLAVHPIGLGKSDSQTIDLSKYLLRIKRGDVLTLAVRATSSTTDATAGISWIEE